MRKPIQIPNPDDGHRRYKDQMDEAELAAQKSPLAPRKTTKSSAIVRTVLVVGLFIAGIVFLLICFFKSDERKPGWYEINAQMDKKVPKYQLGEQMTYLFTGSTKQIKQAESEVTKLYTSALKSSFAQLDPKTSYSGYTGIADINAHLGEEVTVSRELLAVLRDADRLTRENRGFNLYAGGLYAEWNSILYLADPTDFDPLNNPDEAERISRLAEAAAELDNFHLQFTEGETCTVRLDVSQAYLALVEDLELTGAPVLDLNVLQEAYKLRMVADKLESRGYCSGYLTGNRGVTVALSECNAEGLSYAFTGHQEEGDAPAAYLPITPGSCAVNLLGFAAARQDGESEPGYYAIEQEGTIHYRHPVLASDGQFHDNLLLSAFVWSDKLSPAEVCLACLELYRQDSPNETKAFSLTLSDCSAAFLFWDDPMTVWSTDSNIIPASDYRYTGQLLVK